MALSCLIISVACAVPVAKSAHKASVDTEPSDIPATSTVDESTLTDSLTPPRRVIAYDQRQDGHFNIRADLENFVILVVPQSGSSGVSLLDLLKRSHTQKRNKHVQKKYHAHPEKGEEKKMLSKLDYLKPHPDEPVEITDEAPKAVGEFIEGRTPYRVDISSTELLQPSKVAQPQPPVAVLRAIAPVGPIAIREKMGSPVIAEIKGNAEPTPLPINRYRKSLTFEGNGNINTNSVLLTPLAQDQSNNADADVHLDAVDDSEHNLRPDFIDLTDTNNSFDSLNIGNLDLATGTDNSGDERWQLELLGAQEQCGPDRRRDSYGVCQFVPKDYSP